jgi:hypothetical protein
MKSELKSIIRTKIANGLQMEIPDTARSDNQPVTFVLDKIQVVKGNVSSEVFPTVAGVNLFPHESLRKLQQVC